MQMLKNKVFKKILKWTLISVGSLVGFVIVYIGAVYTLPLIRVEREEITVKQDVEVYLLTNGAHTDIVVPAKNSLRDWTADFKFTDPIAVDSTYQWIGIGWGDKGFYLEIPTWDELTFRIAFRAAFALSTTAIHATFYQTMAPGEGCVKILMSQGQYQRLVAYINHSLKRDLMGRVQKIQTNALYSTNDAFYEARGRYNIFKTCNTWTNTALKVSGQRACLWTALDDGLFEQYESE